LEGVMAISAVVRTIVSLIRKHGLSSGVKKARKMGFKSKDIKAAKINFGKDKKNITLPSGKKLKLKKGYINTGPPDYKVVKADKYGNKTPTPRFLEKDVSDYKTLPRRFREPQDIDI
tara:strand:+ start:8765 stop:9115 length:351 start_codon:yes stop_codon:yes gene_type:complete